MKRLLIAAFAAAGLVLAASATAGYWDNARTLHAGIEMKELSLKEPRLMRAFMVRVDLKTPGISFTATERDPDWGKPMSDYTNRVLSICTRRETTARFLQRKRAAGKPVVVAINTAPWEPFCAPWNHKWANPTCWNVSDGVELCRSGAGRGALFVVRKDGSVEITRQVPAAETNQVAYAMCGFGVIATNGVKLCSEKDRACHPRTAFGLSADKRHLFLLAVDGRQKDYSLGADMHDLCAMMFEAGAADVVNMDGGGSTSLVYYDADRGEPVMVNHHANNGRRSVAVNFGICFDDSSTRVDELLAKMTLEEKVGQLVQIHTQGEVDGVASSDSSQAKLDEKLVAVLKRGGAGTLIGACGAKRRNAFQKIAVEESRLGIPILVGHDIIHGTTTVLPIPLGLSATWDADVWRKGAEIIGLESRLKGVDWTFNPMLDVSRDARWGRIAECPGQDPYLGALYAAAMVKGYQGENLQDGLHVAACAKHYVAYGAATGGRDYNFVEMSDDTLRDIYLPAFKAAVDAGVATIMPAFHSFNGVPCSGNRYLLRTILRDEWKWPGMTISDWGAVGEMDLGHTIAKGKADASAKALMAGMDVDMMSRYYEEGLPAALAQGQITEARLDEAVRHVLLLKERLGLFAQPYVDEARVTAQIATQDHVAIAREAAAKSLVLLKNDGTLPLVRGKKVALLGELAADAKEMLGTWQTWNVTNARTTLLAGLKAAGVEVTYVKVYTVTGSVDVAAVRAACQAADVVLGTFGEYREMNGEAKSRSSIELPGEQKLAFETMVASGKPVVAVLFNGRPLAVPYMKEKAAAVLEAWNPGNEAGVAMADVLTGVREPYGRLTVDFPNCTGECPKFYNRPLTGRPYTPGNMWTSRYLDCPDASVWPFGFGLTYTTFAYANEKVEREGDDFVFTADLSNTGVRAGSEVVQVYVRDLVARRVRPRRELKGFARVTLKPGETKTVRIVVPVSALGYHVDGAYVVEPGDFQAWIAPDSDRGKTLTFTL